MDGIMLFTSEEKLPLVLHKVGQVGGSPHVNLHANCLG